MIKLNRKNYFRSLKMKIFGKVSAIIVILMVTTTYLIAEKKASKTQISTPSVVHKFQSEQDIQNFILLIRSKQETLQKLAVLQSYISTERNNLNRISGQLLLNYKVDPDKNYTLDPENKVLVEAVQKQGKVQRK